MTETRIIRAREVMHLTGLVATDHLSMDERRPLSRSGPPRAAKSVGWREHRGRGMDKGSQRP